MSKLYRILSLGRVSVNEKLERLCIIESSQAVGVKLIKYGGKVKHIY